MPNQYLDDDVQQIANEITRYLQEHDSAADTLEGVAQWWVLRQRLQEERNKVERAMHYLCEQGIVETRSLPDGKILYAPVVTIKK
ncbi:MAG TPA: hypothetical protein VN030_03345 [Cellvibrio sp.]|nr:hypothetical protein [Cellvibrio sp.]